MTHGEAVCSKRRGVGYHPGEGICLGGSKNSVGDGKRTRDSELP